MFRECVRLFNNGILGVQLLHFNECDLLPEQLSNKMFNRQEWLIEHDSDSEFDEDDD